VKASRRLRYRIAALPDIGACIEGSISSLLLRVEQAASLRIFQSFMLSGCEKAGRQFYLAIPFKETSVDGQSLID
jgi:hypothetical protein